jgi:signal peptidase I
MFLRWLLSGTVRQAADLCHRVQKLVNAQRDQLSSQASEAIGKAVGDVRNAIHGGAGREVIVARLTDLEASANKWLKPYPAAAVRENVDVILVALVVALAFRTFFLQPMAIPTGSMQPTLYGITEEDLRREPETKIPNRLVRLFESLALGVSYYHVTAEEDGEFLGFEPPRTIFPFIKKQRLLFGNRTHDIWFPPDNLQGRAGLQKRDHFRRGEDIIKLKIRSGDRLFVDRVTYNFRRPARGEIIIFETKGIDALREATEYQDTHYIKRLIGLGGDKVQIGADRHVIINGNRLDAAASGFENLYSFNGPAEANHYSGHVHIGAKYFRDRGVTPQFHDESSVFTVQPNHYVVMGDNTLNSFDSRYWGDFLQEKVVGKCAFVFWPISPRFGWGFR